MLYSRGEKSQRTCVHALVYFSSRAHTHLVGIFTCEFPAGRRQRQSYTLWCAAARLRRGPKFSVCWEQTRLSLGVRAMTNNKSAPFESRRNNFLLDKSLIKTCAPEEVERRRTFDGGGARQQLSSLVSSRSVCVDGCWQAVSLSLQ